MAEISQRPGALNIIYTKGDDLPIAITLGVNISGHTIAAKVTQAKAGTVLSITVTSVLPASGSLTLKFPKEIFGTLPIGSHEWALTDTDESGNVRKWLAGLFTVVSR